MKKVPMRKCIACNQSMPKKSLLRIVRTSDNSIKFDVTGKLNGRGLYVCSITCLNKAIKTKRINKLLESEILQEDINKVKEEIDEYIKNQEV